MGSEPVDRILKEISRRDFLYLSSMTAAGFMAGCATNPVSGQSQLMLMSENEEIQIDKKNSPYQFSSDYGTSQDTALNNYIDRIGKDMAAKTHRPGMPYSFRVVNATYVNAYAFPGGSIAATRGIMLALDNEAELAALLGHELGHVNARHTAQRMTKGTLTQIVVGGITAYAGARGGFYGDLAATLGSFGAGALLASYSRENEREADDLGMKYMVKTGYSPKGMVGLMEMLKGMMKHKPNAIELMFSTHPMSEERYQTSVETAKTFKSAQDYPVHKERYMDHTAKLRLIKGAILDMQLGESAMAKGKFKDAETLFNKALKVAPDDYCGLVLMAKCQLALKNNDAAQRYADKAKSVYPQEAQGHQLAGFAKIKKKNFSHAYTDFSTSDKLLPGNPSNTFLKGLCLEGMGKKEDSAKEYYRYLQTVKKGKQAEYSYRRLVEWGYVKK